MSNQDSELLKIYMVGFDDELWSLPVKTYSTQIEQSAYQSGRYDAILGDDVTSNDDRTNEEILVRIKEFNNRKEE